VILYLCFHQKPATNPATNKRREILIYKHTNPKLTLVFEPKFDDKGFFILKKSAYAVN